jgi:hypothetical protein
VGFGDRGTYTSAHAIASKPLSLSSGVAKDPVKCTLFSEIWARINPITISHLYINSQSARFLSNICCHDRSERSSGSLD